MNGNVLDFKTGLAMLVGYCITKKQSFWPVRNRTLKGYCVTRIERTVNEILQKTEAVGFRYMILLRIAYLTRSALVFMFIFSMIRLR